MIPLALSIAGSLAPPILSALFGAKTEQQARDSVAPQYNAMLMRLMAQEGMGRVEAERAADEAMRPEIEKAKSEGALPGWAEGLLSVAGGIGGWAAGAKLAGKVAAKAVAGEAAKDIGKIGGRAVPGGSAKAIPKGPPTIDPNAETLAGPGARMRKPAAKTKTPDDFDESAETAEHIPLNIDHNLADTVAMADTPTTSLSAFPRGMADTVVINPKMARTQRINPVSADTEILDPNLTQLMAAFPR